MLCPLPGAAIPSAAGTGAAGKHDAAGREPVRRPGVRRRLRLLRDGLVIEDVSDYQNRLPHPRIRIISKLFWTGQGIAESMIPVKIKGHPYLISIDVGDEAHAWARTSRPRQGRSTTRRQRLPDRALHRLVHRTQPEPALAAVKTNPTFNAL